MAGNVWIVSEFYMWLYIYINICVSHTQWKNQHKLYIPCFEWKNLVFRYGLLWSHLWMTQPVGIDRTYYWIDPLLACWYCSSLYYFSNVFFCILVHAYILWFIGSPCYKVGCYNYNSIWPYYTQFASYTTEHYCAYIHVWQTCDQFWPHLNFTSF